MREHCLSVSTDCAYVAPQWQFWDRKKVFNLKLLKTETQLNVHIRETGVHGSFSDFFEEKKKKTPCFNGFYTHRHTHLLNWYCACLISVTKFVWLFEKIKSTDNAENLFIFS